MTGTMAEKKCFISAERRCKVAKLAESMRNNSSHKTIALTKNQKHFLGEAEPLLDESA